jgi:hypothetical protein
MKRETGIQAPVSLFVYVRICTICGWSGSHWECKISSIDIQKKVLGMQPRFQRLVG